MTSAQHLTARLDMRAVALLDMERCSTGGVSFEDLVAQAASAEAAQPTPKAMPMAM